jgi:hypothetical protein
MRDGNISVPELNNINRVAQGLYGLYVQGMTITARGVVQGGRLKVDIPVDLPDNTVVELTETPGDGYDEEDPLLAAALDRAEEQSTRGEGSSWEEVEARLHARDLRDEALPDPHPPRG